MAIPTKPTDIGANRTGLATSPRLGPLMVEAANRIPPAPGDASTALELRASYATDAPPVGTVPLPMTLKGLAKTALQALRGDKATVFLDKLSERLAFERTGVRLYEAVLAKIPASRVDGGSMTVDALHRIRDDEHRHLHLVRDAILSLGADPTVVSPCADLKGLQSEGLMKTVTDPRTTLTQCLDVLLTAELADHEGWEILIDMAEALGQDAIASSFAVALREEERHLFSVRVWLRERIGIELGEPLAAIPDGAAASAPMRE